jgi:hypothetical protein
MRERHLPFAVDRRVEIGGEPVESREVGEAFGDAFEPLVRDDRIAARRQRHDTVVEPLQREAVQVGEVARDMKLGDLALALAQILVAAHDALEQQDAVRQHCAREDHIIVRGHGADLRDGIADGLLFFRTHGVARPELEEMPFYHLSVPPKFHCFTERYDQHDVSIGVGNLDPP